MPDRISALPKIEAPRERIDVVLAEIESVCRKLIKNTPFDTSGERDFRRRKLDEVAMLILENRSKDGSDSHLSIHRPEIRFSPQQRKLPFYIEEMLKDPNLDFDLIKKICNRLERTLDQLASVLEKEDPQAISEITNEVRLRIQRQVSIATSL